MSDLKTDIVLFVVVSTIYGILIWFLSFLWYLATSELLLELYQCMIIGAILCIAHMGYAGFGFDKKPKE